MDQIQNPALLEQAERAKRASRVLFSSTAAVRNDALGYISESILNSKEAILEANAKDLEAAAAAGMTPTQMDRLRLDQKRIDSMALGVRDVQKLPEIVGNVQDGWVRPNGLRVKRVRVPLGLVGIIYENRPNVTSDAAALCLKSANATMLRGSSSAYHSNAAICDLISDSLEKAGLPRDAVSLVKDTRRESALDFMRLEGFIDCLIPRGGKSLIRAIKESATVPYIIDGDGNCHIYVDQHADLKMASSIVVNAKCQRPGVCNAAESLLVHAAVAEEFLSMLRKDLVGVEIRGDERTLGYYPGSVLATEEDYATEFLDLILSVKVVDSIEEATRRIQRYGSGHSEAIVTSNISSANFFVANVDSAAVLVNASTRFVDGAEVGFGAEIGISTQKLHARGPMGLEALTTLRFVIEGEGQVR
ncbi:MAG: glutamate-5-semialdehyde dehydrogenase [Acidimicrobiaceae bacterium]|nr:glutamate-5-semialdehyde dehydrogenase [Acidimicrobiaceae bacterium]